MFCKYCGKQIKDGTSFCVYCGRPQGIKQPAPVTQEPEPYDAPAPSEEYSTCAETMIVEEPQPPVYVPVAEPTTNYVPQPAAEAPKKKSGSAATVIIAILLVIIALLSIGGYFVVTQYVIPAMEEQNEEKQNEEDEDSGKNAETTAPVDSEEEVPEDEKDTPKEPAGENHPAENETLPVESETAPMATEPVVSNPYLDYLETYPNYILPDSATSYQCYTDLQNLSPEALTLASQEIYARHGKIFSDPHLQAYFEARSWYTPQNSPVSLNLYEHANVELIRVYQAKQDGSLYRSGNPYLVLYSSDDYAISGSNSRYLNAYDVKTMSADELCIVRNEILARRGCVFTDSDLREYFYSKSWYKPTTQLADYNLNQLNKYETNNLTFVQAYERRAKGLTIPAGGHEYSVEYQRYLNYDYFFSYSSSDYLYEYDILNLPYISDDALELARNEIYARNGYTFSDEALMDYFMTKSWYYPTTPVGDQSSLDFSAVELANIKFLKEYELLLESNS